MRWRRHKQAIVAGVSLLAVAALAGTPAAQLRTDSLPRDLEPGQYMGRRPALECGTDFTRQVLGLRLAAVPLADGEPLFFLQDPPILLPDHAGELRFRDFLVVGDFETVQFKRYDPGADAEHIETWSRTESRTIGGRIISVFQPSWPVSELERILRRAPRGFDYPQLFWGEFLVPGTAPPEKRQVQLRLGSTNVPPARADGASVEARITRLSDTVQFASHVVNLVIPDFGNSRVDGGQRGLDLEDAARRFYQHFEDAYETIAFIPQATHVASYAAFHEVAKNTVRGIGLSLLDNSAAYGSRGTLHSVELYPQAAFATNDGSTHELLHQWGNYFDWARIGSIARAGREPSSHSPLWTGGETMLGAVLEGTRRVRESMDGGYEIERTPSAMRYHPIELYAMGKVSSDAVPDLMLFDEQGQFNASGTAEPEPGAKVQGTSKVRSIRDVIREHGARIGPSPEVWRRATVVVSRDGLISAQEMAYWNFFAQRLEDPDRTGVPSYDGYSSFDLATHNTVDLKTDITPRPGTTTSVHKITQPLEVSYPRFGRRDWRGVEFDASVPSRFGVGERVRLSGRVTATDRRDYNQVLVRYWKYGGESEDAVRLSSAVSRSGDFSVNLEFTEGQRGAYFMEVFLFWRDSGPQFPRSSLSPVFVQ